jgi:hypothetical protein
LTSHTQLYTKVFCVPSVRFVHVVQSDEHLRDHNRWQRWHRIHQGTDCKSTGIARSGRGTIDLHALISGRFTRACGMIYLLLVPRLTELGSMLWAAASPAVDTQMETRVNRESILKVLDWFGQVGAVRGQRFSSQQLSQLKAS